MTLRHEPDVSQADWFVHSGDDWTQLCEFGPSGFPAYARVLHPTDEEIADEDQRLLDVEGDLEDAQLSALCEVLVRHTSTAADCFFGLWDGFGSIYGGNVLTLRPGHETRSRQVPAAFDSAVLASPRVTIPQRAYLLFRGPLADAGRWPSRDAQRINSPNLIWPADHAWFVATEIDQPWSGVGGPIGLVEELLAHELLDVRPGGDGIGPI